MSPFKNIIPYQIVTPIALGLEALREKLEARPLLPCGALAMESNGWVDPAPTVPGVLQWNEVGTLIALGCEQKILPGAAVKDAVAEKAKAIEARMGFMPGKKQLREIKDQVLAELLPKALTRRRITRALILRRSNLLLVDTSSAARAEALTAHLRDTLGELAVCPLDTEQQAERAMTEWVRTGRPANGLGLDQDCAMKNGGDDPGVVRFAKHGLEGDDVRRHVTDGKTVIKLGLTVADCMRFALAAHPVRLLAVKTEAREKEPTEEGGFEPEFFVNAHDAGVLVQAVVGALGGLRGGLKP